MIAEAYSLGEMFLTALCAISIPPCLSCTRLERRLPGSIWLDIPVPRRLPLRYFFDMIHVVIPLSIRLPAHFPPRWKIVGRYCRRCITFSTNRSIAINIKPSNFLNLINHLFEHVIQSFCK